MTGSLTESLQSLRPIWILGCISNSNFDFNLHYPFLRFSDAFIVFPSFKIPSIVTIWKDYYQENMTVRILQPSIPLRCHQERS